MVVNVLVTPMARLFVTTLFHVPVLMVLYYQTMFVKVIKDLFALIHKFSEDYQSFVFDSTKKATSSRKRIRILTNTNKTLIK